MEHLGLKQQILEAIQNGDYEISIEEPNNISERTKYDGSIYYVLHGDDVKFGACAGYCHVYIGEHEFTCNLDDGEWESSCNLEDDEDIIVAIESIDGVISGSHMGNDEYMDIYYAANPNAPEGPAYGDDDSDMPKDPDDLGWDDAYIDVVYVNKDGEDELECIISDQQLYYLYQLTPDGDAFNGEFFICDNDIKDYDEDTFITIKNQIVDEENNDETTVKFKVRVTPDTFESQLG